MDTSEEHILQVNKIKKIADNIISQISITYGEKIVAFIGPPKSGKSTLINCLLKNHLKVMYDSGTDETRIVKADQKGPIIDHNATTESFIPQQHSKLPGTAYRMVDFPGFGSIIGTEQEIASALVYEEVLRAQRSVKFVLVVPIGMIKSDNPMAFFQLLSDLVTLCPSLPGSLCIVASKTGKTTVDTCLRKAMSPKFSRANEETLRVINIAKSVIKKVLESNLWIDFKEPAREDNNDFTVPNLEDIIDLIKSLKSMKIETDIPVSISETSKYELFQLHVTIESQLRNDIKNIVKYFGNKQSKQYKEELKKLEKLLKNSTDLESFIEKIKIKNDFSDWPLIENLRAIHYVDFVVNKFKIGGNLERQDMRDIFNDICTQISLVFKGNNSNNANLEFVSNQEITTKNKLYEVEQGSVERQKKISKHVQETKSVDSPQCHSEQRPSLGKHANYELNKSTQIKRNKNEFDSEPLGDSSYPQYKDHKRPSNNPNNEINGNEEIWKKESVRGAALMDSQRGTEVANKPDVHYHYNYYITKCDSRQHTQQGCCLKNYESKCIKREQRLMENTNHKSDCNIL